MNPAVKVPRTIPLTTRVLFGAGSVSDGVKNTTFNTFLLFFYTQVVGLSGSLAGAAIFIALLFDAVTDPLVGSISDNFHSRWGRRHPFMYAAALPMAVFFVLLFHPPEDLSQGGKFAWMLCFAIGVRVSMTFYAVPSASLVAEMTPVYDERTSIVSFRVLSGWIGGLLAAQAGYLYFFAPSAEFADGRLNPAAYGDYALVAAIAIFGAILTCSLGTHKLIPTLHALPESTRFTFRNFLSELRVVFTNRAYLVLVFTILTLATAVGFTDVMNLYVNTYFWELQTWQIAMTVYGALAGTILAFASTTAISTRTDKKTAAIACVSVIVFAGPAPVVLRLLDLMPANGHPALLPILVVHVMLIVYVAVAVTILVGSMIADIIDQNELATGKRQEGMFNAAFALTSKATSGLGGFFGGIVIELVSFPTGAAAGAVDQQTLTALGLAVGPGIFIFWFTALMILLRYPLKRSDHARIVAELQARKRSAEPASG